MPRLPWTFFGVPEQPVKRKTSPGRPRGWRKQWPVAETGDVAAGSARVCKTCELPRYLDAYEPNRLSCRQCVRAQAHERVARGEKSYKSSAALREWYLGRRYGITADQADELLAAQGGVCAMCEHPISFEAKTAVLDHCHDTGLLRGCLCSPCNSALGQLEDDVKRFENGAAYLRRAAEQVADGAGHYVPAESLQNPTTPGNWVRGRKPPPERAR